jgi:inorganic pyrophosphatase
MNIDIIIEIPKNTNIKYEFDQQTQRLRVDRILNIPMVYPGHYGYMPSTLADDNDCLDVLLVSDQNFTPGSIISGKVIGVLLMEDEKGLDHKIICVPSDDVDKHSKQINSLSDIDCSQIEYFFGHYKDLETKKWAKCIGWKGISEAIEIINKSLVTN